jgi:hypothetical protein
MQKAKETAGKFVKAREDMTKLLDLVEKTLDQSPFPVAPGIIFAWLLAILARRDNRDRSVIKDKGNQVIAIEGAIPQDVIPDLVTQQRLGLRTLMTFATGQDEAQGITQPIDFGMDFGAKAAATPSQRLRVLPTVFLTPLPRTDARAQCSHPASHFPYQGHRQNGPSSVPTRDGRTTGQSVCRHCSSSHIQPGASAIEPHFEASTSWLRQSGDTHFRVPHTPVGTPVESPRLSSIDRHVMLWLS